jgi:hypothetical protein
MSRRLTSFLEASAVFAGRAIALELVLQEGLDRTLRVIKRQAASKIGSYQDASGGFPEWAPLSEVTISRKSASGFAVPSPLLATGAMLASFDHESNGLEGVAGAKDPKAVYHETGTSRMPARPVWGPAAYESRDAIQALLGAAVVAGISGEPDRLPDPDSGGWRYQIRV